MVLFLLFVIITYNSLINSQQKVKNSWAQIDVQLKKRADLVYNLVEVVKSYAKYEKKTLTQITEERTKILDAQNRNEVITESNALTKAFKSIFAVVENYPELKADKQFLELQKQLAALEDDIAYARMVYNDVVTLYNTALLSFPQNLIAPVLGFKEQEHLKANEIERASVAVKL